MSTVSTGPNTVDVSDEILTIQKRMDSVADAEIQAFSLANHWLRSSAGRIASATPLLARRRGELIEPSSADRITEIVHSALRQAEQSLVGRPQEATGLRGRIGEGEPAVEALRVEFPEARHLCPSDQPVSGPVSSLPTISRR